MIVVDSSVAIKWFVPEPEYERAIYLLKGDESLSAPSLILAEVANALQRKLRNDEIGELQVTEAIQELEQTLALRAIDAGLTTLAFRLARAIDHSIYDCVFLAHAVESQRVLVTADRKFFSKAASVGLTDKMRLLSEAPIAIAFSESELAAFNALYETFAKTRAYVEREVYGKRDDDELVIKNAGDLRPALDSPPYRKLVNKISELSPHQAANLLATCWLGRGFDGQDYAKLYRQASHLASRPVMNAPYIISLLRHLESGIALSRANKSV